MPFSRQGKHSRVWEDSSTSQAQRGCEEPPARDAVVSPAFASAGPPPTAACALLVIHPLAVVILLVISYNSPRLHREMPVSIGRGGAAGITQEETFLFLQHQSHKISICLFFFFLYFTSDYNCFHFSAKREYLKQCRRGRHRGLWALAAAK